MIEWSEQDKELRNSILRWADKLDSLKSDSSFNFDHFAKKWQLIKDMGILGLPLNENFGGLNCNVTSTMYMLEAFGSICSDAGLGFSLSSHIVSCVIPINKFGTDEQKNHFLPKLSSGNFIGAHAITEPQHGSDAWSMNTFAQQREDGYVINGQKTFISNGPVADVIILYAKTKKEGGALGGYTAFLLEKGNPGLTVGKPTKKMGLNTSPICDLYFDDCFISNERVLGKPGKAFPMFNYVMKWEILLSFIQNVGEMEALMYKCIDYAKSRNQFGKAISEYQAVSHKIANMKIAVETARNALYNAGIKFRKGKNTTADIAIAKIVASEGYAQTALDALQVFGGYGYMAESGIEESVRNALGSKIYSGTSEIQRNTIASMLGL